MKRVLAIILAALMCVAFASCAQDTGANDTPSTAPASTAPASTEPAGTEPDTSDFSGDITLKVMLMPSGDMNADTVTKVTDAVNARITELGYQFKVEFLWSGGAWGWDNLDTALKTVADLDIIPAHTWSGNVTYTVGAQTGQYLRLDDPENNLLEKYGKNLYGKTAPAITAAATVPGDQGTGIYAYIIEKDSVSQLGYLINKTALEEIGFTVDDFKADDLASWEPILKAYKEANPDKYPLNVEAEVLDRTANHVAFVDNTIGSLGVIFDNADPASTKVTIASRYESDSYKSFATTMNEYYKAGYVDPDQGIAGEVSSTSVANRRTDGDFLISTFVYAPGAEGPVAQSASAAQGKDIEIVWAPGWVSPIATTETALGSGLAVYAGTNYAPEAVTFLDMLASDAIIGNLVGEGIEGESYEVKDGVAWRIGDRAGWNIWRYGVIGATSAALPLGDVDPTGEEWTNLKNFNSEAAALESTGWLFDETNVEVQYAACNAVIDKYAIPLGSGAADPAQYDAFITELKANGVDDVVAEAKKQYDEWFASKG